MVESPNAGLQLDALTISRIHFVEELRGAKCGMPDSACVKLPAAQ